VPDAVRQEDEAIVVVDPFERQSGGTEAPREERRAGTEHHRRDAE
jgi:hypothetical protein